MGQDCCFWSVHFYDFYMIYVFWKANIFNIQISQDFCSNHDPMERSEGLHNHSEVRESGSDPGELTSVRLRTVARWHGVAGKLLHHINTQLLIKLKSRITEELCYAHRFHEDCMKLLLLSFARCATWLTNDATYGQVLYMNLISTLFPSLSFSLLRSIMP